MVISSSMRGRARNVGALAAGCVLAVACAPARAGSPVSTSTAAGTVGDRVWADSVLSTLTLRQKAAQLVWPQLFGDFTAENSAGWIRLQRMITEDEVGGFIMSIGSPVETAVKLNAMQRISRLPLVIGADYETGAGFRTRGGYFLPNAIDLGGATNFPPMMAFGAAGDSALAYELGRITAIEGRAVGVHVGFAPVLDVNNNPLNPVIGPRSFGEDPHLVSRLGTAVIRGMQDHGMMATAKHFPGHGDTEQNSHLSITTVTASRARLDSVELVPFRRAIAAGVGAIMTFHGVVPALDTTPVPATLSRVVMTDLLRRQLGFQGLLVTDALDMTGVLAQVAAQGAGNRPAGQPTTVTSTYGTFESPGLAEVTKKAIEAGADILLMPLDVKTSVDAVVAGVREGRFTEARVDSSVRRVLALKERLGLHRRRIVDADSVRIVVADTANVGVANRVGERSITLAKDSLNVVPMTVGTGAPRVLSITVAPRNNLGAGTTFNAELRRGLTALRTEYVDPANPDLSIPRLLALADSVDVVIVGSYLAQGTTVSTTAAPSPVVTLIRQMTERKPRTVVVSFGDPYFLRHVPFAPAYVVAWGGFQASQRAAALALIGQRPITGRLPITIPPLLQRGAGIQREGRR